MITRVRFPQPVEAVARLPRSVYSTVIEDGSIHVAALSLVNGCVRIQFTAGGLADVAMIPGTVIDVEPDEPAANPPAARPVQTVERKTRR